MFQQNVRNNQPIIKEKVGYFFKWRVKENDGRDICAGIEITCEVHMKIIIKSYIKEKVKIELWQCSQNILSIDLSEGEDCVTDIDLPVYGKTEILVAVSYEEPEEAGNFLLIT